jgi:DNA invertase Pin-like site-specific DNA recombinase
VWKLDRLARSLRDLITMLNELRERGIRYQSLTEAIDTETPTGRAMWQMIGVLAELERSPISERTRRRSEVGAAPGREIWAEAEAVRRTNQSRPEIDRRRRIPPVRGGPAERKTGYALSGAWLSVRM